jgi:hypothetical protein
VPYFGPKVGFLTILYDFIDFSASFGRFWPLLEDLELFLRPDLGRKLGVCYQLEIYINQRFLEALKGVHKRRNVEEIVNPKPFLCREAIEESNFAGHFTRASFIRFQCRQLCGFLRYKRTQPDHFVIHLTLL